MATVSKKSLRRIALKAQGLLSRSPFGRGASGTLRAIRHLGYVQIDTISVVARAHHHTLWNRIPNYRTRHLEELVETRRVFEYWYHAASYLPIEDYRFALPRMSAVRGDTHRWASISRNKKLMKKILDRIAAEGPLKASDFDEPGAKAGGWGNWKPHKRALEQLFARGDLMVHGRQGFQKIWDLRERVLPAEIETRAPTLREQADYFIDYALSAHGFAHEKSFTYLQSGGPLRKAVRESLQERVASQLVAVLETADGDMVYALTGVLAARLKKPSDRVRLLSPFDNAVIQRDRNLRIHDFDYQLECYLPESKRRYGYFCLPIVYGDRIVGRADCKAHRADRIFELKHVHIETDLGDRERFLEQFLVAVGEFAAFDGCESTRITRTSPSSWLRPMRSVSLRGA